MSIDRAALEQLKHLLRPLATRVVNMVARGVVQIVDDSKKLQLVQLGVLAGETVEGANPGGGEHFQPYGFSSVPLAGAEAVVVFPNGDRSHPLVIAASDRRHRPTGGAAGDVVVYNAAGARVTLFATGNIEIKPAPGGQVLIDDGTAGAEPLVTRSEFLNHAHATAGTGTPSPPVTSAVAGSSVTFPGTAVLAAK